MLISDIAIAQFTSAATAGVVNVMLGFIPDYLELYINVTGTNPNKYVWFNNADLSLWPATLNLLDTGSTGVITAGTSSGIVAYAGDEQIAAAESVDADPIHVDQSGNVVGAAGITDQNGTLPFNTWAGVKILAALQVNSGINMMVAYRRNR